MAEESKPVPYSPDFVAHFENLNQVRNLTSLLNNSIIGGQLANQMTISQRWLANQEALIIKQIEGHADFARYTAEEKARQEAQRIANLPPAEKVLLEKAAQKRTRKVKVVDGQPSENA